MTERMEQFNICYAKAEVGAFSDGKPQPAIHKFHLRKNKNTFLINVFLGLFFLASILTPYCWYCEREWWRKSFVFI